MSDADDQLGGTGGERGRKPSQPDPGHGSTEGQRSLQKDTEVDSDSQESFPASDPPGTY